MFFTEVDMSAVAWHHPWSLLTCCCPNSNSLQLECKLPGSETDAMLAQGSKMSWEKLHGAWVGNL